MKARRLEPFPAPLDLRIPQPEQLFALLHKTAPISEPWSVFACALMTKGRLDIPQRELAILRVGCRRDCDYILSGHLPVARHAGVSSTRIRSAFDQAPEEAADAPLLAAVDELLAEGTIHPAARRTLDRALSEEEIIELVMLVGQYVLVSMVCETFSLKPEPRAGTPGH